LALGGTGHRIPPAAVKFTQRGRAVLLRRTLLGAAALSVALACAGSVLASASGVVISEFRFRGPVGGNDEYVELLNAGSAAVDISSWRLQGCAAATGAASDRTTVPAGSSCRPASTTSSSTTTRPAVTGRRARDRTYGTGFTDGAGARIVDAGGAAVDGVGGTGVGGTQCREGTGISACRPRTATSPTSASAAHRTPTTTRRLCRAKAGNPQNHAAADAAPSVASTVPADNAAGVPVDTNLQITFSEPVTVDDPWFTIRARHRRTPRR
jgi:hypothetical protein